MPRSRSENVLGAPVTATTRELPDFLAFAAVWNDEREPRRRVYAVKGPGVWITSAMVVIAADKGHARRLAVAKLREAGITIRHLDGNRPVDAENLDVVEVTRDGAHLILDGDY